MRLFPRRLLCLLCLCLSVQTTAAAAEAVTEADAAAIDNASPEAATAPTTMNQIGEAYVRLVLALGEQDSDTVDAWYGPAAIRGEVKREALPLARIEAEAQALLLQVDGADSPAFQTRPELVVLRREYLKKQLAALVARAQMIQGQRFTFDDEARALYDTRAPHYTEADFAPVLARIEKLLPRESGDAGRSLAERYNRYIERYAVPPAKLKAVMELAIEEARVRAYRHLPLPVGEHFELSFVSGKPWSAYNWYQGRLSSRIEVNTELPIAPARVLELASHEGYPGHHVYNALLENGLVIGQQWPEYTVYALFSPQSLIAEGTADYGVGLAFPGRERLAFMKELFAEAGLNPRDAARYLEIVAAARELVPAGIEAARRYLDGKVSADDTLLWMQRFLLYSQERAVQRLKFIDKYRSYIINYSWGEQLVSEHIRRHGNSHAGSPGQWQQFFQLISQPRTPAMLVADEDAVTVADVDDVASFEAFIATRPTLDAFAARYPAVLLVRPGMISTREFRSDRSRYFPDLDDEGRITGGRFN